MYDQNFKSVLQLIKEAFFKHGEKDSLRSCVKAVNFCASESRGELKDFAQNQLKELEDELIAKLRSAMNEIAVNYLLCFTIYWWSSCTSLTGLCLQDGDDEYSLLVNLKRLYELQLSKPVSIEGLYENFAQILQSFRNMDDEVCYSYISVMIFLLPYLWNFFFLSKCSTLIVFVCSFRLFVSWFLTCICMLRGPYIPS